MNQNIHCTSKSMKITSTCIVCLILTMLILLVSQHIDGLINFCLVFDVWLWFGILY